MCLIFPTFGYPVQCLLLLLSRSPSCCSGCLQKQTSRQGKPLKTHVMHTSVVAFQMLAARCLSWLQRVTSKSEGLRRLFCQLILQDEAPGQPSVVERLLLADTKLWKGRPALSHVKTKFSYCNMLIFLILYVYLIFSCSSANP